MLVDQEYDEFGKPVDKSYLECNLPNFLKIAIQNWLEGERKARENKSYTQLDMDFCELQSEINVAEVESLISSQQAWYLREKYLGITRE